MFDGSLKAALRKIYNALECFRDRRDGTDTATPLSKVDFNVASPNGKYAIQYLPADRALLRRLFKSLPFNPAEFTFVDVGCGRGRVLMYALRRGFRRIVGIEFEPTLVEAAEGNIKSLCQRRRLPRENVEFFPSDIAEHEFADENLFIFLYNPFHETMMRRLVERLEEWLDANAGQHKLFVAYMNPVHGYLFQESSHFKEIVSLRKLVTIYPADGFPVVLFEGV